MLFQTPPTTDEMGHCDFVKVDEIGDTSVVLFKQGEFRKYCSWTVSCKFMIFKVPYKQNSTPLRSVVLISELPQRHLLGAHRTKIDAK